MFSCPTNLRPDKIPNRPHLVERRALSSDRNGYAEDSRRIPMEMVMNMKDVDDFGESGGRGAVDPAKRNSKERDRTERKEGLP